MTKHPISRAERLKLREIYLSKKYEEKAKIESVRIRPKRQIKNFIADQETQNELRSFTSYPGLYE